MPICEADPWRLQYFAHVKTAANIPTEDCDAWAWYPVCRWVYNKLAIALSQNLDAAPHGVTPPPRDNAWHAIGRGMLRGFFLWGITTKVQPAVIATLLHRLGTAVADHDAMSALHE